MATPEEIAAARENIIAPDTVIGLILDLRKKQGDTIGTEAASLLEWYIDERSTLMHDLAETRKDYERAQRELEETIARLFRIEEHLHTLADYAGGGEDDHAPPCDPWPEPEQPKQRRKRNG